ncbi:MAG: DUF4114 domain-containing protein [Pseudanabaenaceae cyanobacterium]|jgi:Domain of unknown function (DUF4114)/Bacterial protein of unknown function (DUF839)
MASATITGPSSSQSPYIVPVAPDIQVKSILTVGDAAPNGYKMVGIPDGLGAFDNGDGTFTLLVNHEISSTLGVARAHGGKGAFVSSWVINKSDLSVVSGKDLMQNVYLWDTTTSKFVKSTNAVFNRFCSADLAPVSAFYNSLTGLGTTVRLFLNGEEGGVEGRALAHIVSGANAGTTYQLPYLGKFAWENAVASPTMSNKTVVAGMDDGTGGQVYFYVGTKTNNGTEIDKAGLNNGKVFGVKVAGLTAEDRFTSPVAGTRFSLADLGEVQNLTGAALESNSNAAGVTNFLRPEDGAWDPSSPRDFYFNTTDRYDQVADGVGTQVGNSRVWRLRFDDPNNPEAGGTIEAVVDGITDKDAAGNAVKVNMLDNMTIDRYGHILLQEDVGNQAHNGKIWQYDITTDRLTQLVKFDAARFGDLGLTATAPFTIDEESSGVIDAQDILGPGWFLLDAQAHYTTGIPADLVEGGQLLAMYSPTTAASGSSVNAPSTSTTPYILPVAPGVVVKSIFTVGDATPNGYKMAGIPDGLGAFDNGDGTFTLLMNHELGSTASITRAHGGKGAFVSSWVIKKSDLTVVSGGDLIKNVYNWDTANQKSATTTSVIDFNRFCSADLPVVSAFYNAATGKGTTERLFMNGEEGGANGFAVATVATGANKGNAYILGKFNLSTNGSGLTGVGGWENLLANPYAQDKTIVIGNNDGGTGLLSQSLAVYVGTKTNTGTEVDKAGLTNGTIKFVTIAGNATEIVDTTTRATNITNATAFTLSATGSTVFSRPEDGVWNPLNPNQYFFVTTDRLDQVGDGVGTQIGRSRLWRLNFTDITNPDAGGTIDLLLDGTEGHSMLDNMTIDNYGHILLQEDVGNADRNGKIWQYDIATDSLKLLAKHDPARFGDVVGGVVTAPTAPFTRDEESSGIIDVQSILGAGWSLMVNQAHYTNADPTLVEGGQLLAMYNPTTAASYESSKNNVDSKLIKRSTANDVFEWSSSSSNPAKLKVTLTKGSGQICELGMFTVDDATGAINGVSSTSAAYNKSAIARGQVILSSIDNLPNGYLPNFTRLLQLSPAQNIRFYLQKNRSTTDDLMNGVPSDLQFSNVQKVTDLGGNKFSLEFTDVTLTIESSTENLALGTGLQGNSQGEVLDLRNAVGTVKADFTVNREAAYNNFVGFYKVLSEVGGIDTNGDNVVDLNPGDAGYTVAALKGRVSGIDLAVANQGTAAIGGKQFTGGAIYAPFLISNGTVDQALAGQAHVFFAYLGANSDKVDHVRLLGENTFGFEDLYGGGDRDYNDVIVKAKLTL